MEELDCLVFGMVVVVVGGGGGDFHAEKQRKNIRLK